MYVTASMMRLSIVCYSEHAELLVYDWSEEGEAEVVVEDICRLDLDKYTRYDKKMSDWLFDDEWDWKGKRIM